MLKFAANLTYLFPDRPFLDRFAAASSAGFSGVEFRSPLDWTVDALDERRRRYSLEVTLMNAAIGEWSRGERGLACLPQRRADFRRELERTLFFARQLGCPRLHCMAGFVPRGVSVRQAETCYIDNLLYAADQCAASGVEVMIEPINSGDAPGYFLDSFDKAMTLMTIMAGQGGPQPQLQFDVYHCACIHGGVLQWIERCADRIGYFQIAGVPDRHEPDLGLLPLQDILEAVDRLGLETWIGCEYHPRDDTFDGLLWRERFAPGN